VAAGERLRRVDRIWAAGGATARVADHEWAGAGEPGSEAADARGGIFPNEASCLRLVRALLMELSEEGEGDRGYRTMDESDQIESNRIEKSIEHPDHFTEKGLHYRTANSWSCSKL